MDLMPTHTAQSPEFIASVQDANARRIAAHQQAAGTQAPPPDLLQIDNPEVLRQYLTGMQTRHRDAFPLSDNLIAQFFIIQSEWSDQQRESLISAMSLSIISLENYTYEMMKTQYHDLFIATRTSVQDPSIRPPGGNRSNTFYILETRVSGSVPPAGSFAGLGLLPPFAENLKKLCVVVRPLCENAGKPSFCGKYWGAEGKRKEVQGNERRK